MEDLKAIVESLLFVADKPMSVEKLAEVIEEAEPKAIRSALQALLNEFDNPGRGFRLHEVAGGYQFRTHPECQAYIKRMLKPAPSRLSRAALETLAIIAYKQPIIRSDIEHIRGVDSGGVLRVLMEKKLVRVLGRREIPGRPLIYATTKRFLEVFDLKNLKDLPTPKEIEELTAQEPELEAQMDDAALSQEVPSAAALGEALPRESEGGQPPQEALPATPPAEAEAPQDAGDRQAEAATNSVTSGSPVEEMQSPPSGALPPVPPGDPVDDLLEDALEKEKAPGNKDTSVDGEPQAHEWTRKGA